MKITGYNDKGVTVEGYTLSDNERLMLDNGFNVPVDVRVIDNRTLSDKQRRKVFALLNDIYKHTGQPTESIREIFQFYLQVIKGYETFSLMNCTMSQARELIEVILEWIFMHNIPLSMATSDLMKEDLNFIYHSTVNRICVICGKPNSELAHYQAVGRGRNRNKIDHFGNKVLALCREHHQTQHNMGINSFNKKYHLKDSWIKVDDKLNAMLRGEKN